MSGSNYSVTCDDDCAILSARIKGSSIPLVSSTDRQKVLVVSDSKKTFVNIQSVLGPKNVEALCVSSVAAALEKFTKYPCCLVFIDIHLPWNDRIEMVRIMKAAKIVPIIVFTGPLKKLYLKELYQAGASVILKKPVDYEIFAIQVNNFIELYSGVADSIKSNSPIFSGTELIIDPLYRQVTIKGIELTLTKLEFDLLLCLARYPGQILSQEQLYEQVWKEESGMSVNDTVKVHIGKLRKKLSSASEHTYIRNIRGVGYKFVPPKSNM